ncbi:hypothetical protein [Streptomyces sp. NPDC098781]|uniref:hypothetical protein n=1 Tax=Streptomyces sp. NPDC098781 TaxID=3366097 RepID=UPI00380D407E
MRTTTRRTWAAGWAAAAMLAGLAACTGDKQEHDKDEPGSSGKSDKAVVKACAGGTFTWSGVEERDRLTGVAEMQLVGKGGGELTKPVKRVYTPRPSVRTQGPAVSSAEVLFSLGKKIGEIDTDARTLAEVDGDEWAFTDVNVKAPALNDGTSELDGAGKFVHFTGVREVTGDFSYACPGGKTSTGHARSWRVTIDGILDCDDPASDDPEDYALEAARLSCAEGSPATKGA